MKFLINVLNFSALIDILLAIIITLLIIGVIIKIIMWLSNLFIPGIIGFIIIILLTKLIGKLH